MPAHLHDLHAGTIALPSAPTHLQDPSQQPTQQRSQPLRKSLRFWWSSAPILLCLLLCQLGICVKSLPHASHGQVDFRVFYTTGRLVASGHAAELYSPTAQRQLQNTLVAPDARTLPFLYPAFAALLFVPFALFPYKLAFLLFALTNLLLLVLAATLLRPHLPPQARLPAWLLTTLFLTLFPVSTAWMQGQVTFLLLALYTACFVALRSGRHVLAGALLAATLIKFQLALPIALLFLCWRRGRVLAGFTITALLLAAVSIAITGPGAALSYLASLIHITGETIQSPTLAHQNYGMFPAEMPNLHGLVFLLTHGSATAPLASLLISAVLLHWLARLRPSGSQALLIALPAAMLVSYHLQAYDLTLLLLPLAVAASSYVVQSRPADKSSTKTHSRVLAFAVLPLLIPIAPLLLLDNLSALLSLAVFASLWLARLEDAVLPDGHSARSVERS